MKKATRLGVRTRLGVVAVALAAFAACGGGGGGGGPDLIDLTAANRDTVAHAAAAGMLPLSFLDSIPVFAGPGGVATLRNVAQLARERPMALIPYPPQPCAVAGRVLLTLDDLNSNSQIDLGEPLTIVFEACQDGAYDVFNGTAVMTVTGGSNTTASFTFAMTQLSQQAVNGRHGLTLDGTLNVEAAELSSNAFRWTMTAATQVRAGVHTHLFDDSLELLAGFVEEEIADGATGHVTSNMRGTINSTAAGGAFSVATDTAIGRLYADPYPHEGRLRVSGDRGTMLIAPQSATQVRIDLDSDDDGTFESSEIEDWDWVL